MLRMAKRWYHSVNTTDSFHTGYQFAASEVDIGGAGLDVLPACGTVEHGTQLPDRHRSVLCMLAT